MRCCLQQGDHGLAGRHKYALEEAQRAEKRVSTHTSCSWGWALLGRCHLRAESLTCWNG